MIKIVCLMEELSEIQQTKGKALCGWGGRKRKKKEMGTGYMDTCVGEKGGQ